MPFADAGLSNRVARTCRGCRKHVVFGRVFDGYAIVERIENLKTDPNDRRTALARQNAVFPGMQTHT